MSPDDYMSISTQLELSTGREDGDEECVNITIINDLILEPSETFTVSLSNLMYAENATIGSDSAEVTIEESTGYSTMNLEYVLF